MRVYLAVAITLLIIATPIVGHGQVPDAINYQGRVVDGSGLVSGVIDLELSIWTNATGPGDELYVDSNKVTVVDGLYSTLIGDNTLTGSLVEALSNPDVYIGVKINGDSLVPREPLSSVAYAKRAPRAASLIVAPYGGDYDVPQDAVDALPVAGGKIYISEGIYTAEQWSAVIDLQGRTNIVVQGAGNATWLQGHESDAIRVLGSLDITLRGFRLTGMNACAGVYAHGGTKNLRVEDVTIENFEYGVQFNGSCTNTVVKSCRISGTNSGFKGIDLAGWGTTAVGHPGTLIKGNHIVATSGRGIDSSGSYGTYKTTIQGNRIECPLDSGTYGMYIRGGECQIKDNDVQAGSSGINFLDSSYVEGRSVLSGNTVEVGPNGGSSLFVEGEWNVISDNNIMLANTSWWVSGMIVGDGPATVSGNIVKMLGTNDAIKIYSSASNIAVCGNTVFGNIKSEATGDAGHTFFGNILVGTNDKIIVNSLDTTTEPGSNADDHMDTVDDLYEMNVDGDPGAI